MFPKIKHVRLEVPEGSDPQDRSPTGPKCEMIRPLHHPSYDHADAAARLVKNSRSQ